jgi:hypothetical protein
MKTYKNPVLKDGKHIITSPYGPRVIFGKKQMHTGIDFVGAGNTLDDIVAFDAGTVTISKSSSTAGEYVQINHGDGIYTRYLHMKKGSRKVKVGDKVKKGQILGYMGATGRVTGAHLHFDISINGSYVDPEPYLIGTKSINKPKTAVDNNITKWQKAAIADGFKFPKYGADGNWGSECEAVAKKAICKKRTINKYKNLNKIVQKAVGVEADGKFGKETKAAVIKFQKLVGLVGDGCVGPATWKKILGVK